MALMEHVFDPRPGGIYKGHCSHCHGTQPQGTCLSRAKDTPQQADSAPENLIIEVLLRQGKQKLWTWQVDAYRLLTEQQNGSGPSTHEVEVTPRLDPHCLVQGVSWYVAVKGLLQQKEPARTPHEKLYDAANKLSEVLIGGPSHHEESNDTWICALCHVQIGPEGHKPDCVWMELLNALDEIETAEEAERDYPDE